MTPFAWGVFDCCLYMADWVLDQTGIDPAPHLRGTYASEEECDALLAREGGLLATVERCAAVAGLHRAAIEVPGNVGLIVVGTARGHDLVGAIRGEGRWTFLTPRGIGSWRAAPTAMWSV